jgi:uncharacterized protein YggT (Ycf19 family)
LRTEEVHTYVEDPAHDEMHSVRRTRYYPSGMGMLGRLIVWIFALIELLIGLRVILLLVAARESSPIVSFVYDVTDILVAPFRGVLRINEISSGQTALDVAALVAMIGWAIIAVVILGLVRIFRPARYA